MTRWLMAILLSLMPIRLVSATEIDLSKFRLPPTPLLHAAIQSQALVHPLSTIQDDPAETLSSLRRSKIALHATLAQVLLYPNAVIAQSSRLATSIGADNARALTTAAQALNALAATNEAIGKKLNKGDATTVLENLTRHFDGLDREGLELVDSHYSVDSPEQYTLSAIRSIAAERGVAAAQTLIGAFHQDPSSHTSPNLESAYYWYSQAVEQNYPVAQYLLGRLYFHGIEGVPQDITRAVFWLRQAAEQGHPDAQHLLGSIYYQGEGTRRNWPLGLRWLSKAAQQGYEDAMRFFAARN